jgi:N-acetyl-anhydromuramyl-L-alanine amidase AmpD
MTDITEGLPRHPTKEYEKRSLSDIDMIVVHTTDWDTVPRHVAAYDVAPYTTVRNQRIYNHISKTGCPAITYHEGIMRDGTIYKTLDYKEISWHAGKWNDRSIGVACYYKTTNDQGEDTYPPPPRMISSLNRRLAQLCFDLELTPDKIVGHRELKGTGWFWEKGSRRLRKTCPGLMISMDRVRFDVARHMQGYLESIEYYTGLIDGNFGHLSRQAFKTYLEDL